MISELIVTIIGLEFRPHSELRKTICGVLGYRKLTLQISLPVEKSHGGKLFQLLRVTLLRRLLRVRLVVRHRRHHPLHELDTNIDP